MIVLQKRSCTSMIIGRSRQLRPSTTHFGSDERTVGAGARSIHIRPHSSTPIRTAVAERACQGRRYAPDPPWPPCTTGPQQRRLRWLHQPNWRRARGARASASIAIIPTEPASRPVVAPRLGRRAGHRASASSPTTEVTARAHIARARSDLVSKTEAPPENTRGGSRWPRDVLLSDSARGGMTQC